MDSAIERLKALARGTTLPQSPVANRILAETGLPVVTEAARDPLQSTVEAQLQLLTSAADLPAIAAAFHSLFAQRAFCGNGYRTYRVAQAALMAAAEDPSKAQHPNWAAPKSEPYRRWWSADRSDPAVAACFARALLLDAHGDDAALRVACGEARRVLAFAGPNGCRHWLWRQADFTLTFMAWRCGIEDEALLSMTFDAVQKLDPHEFGIYDDRAIHLLPQWAGDAAAMEDFARASARRTSAHFGNLLYARIYDTVLGFEATDATAIDPQRFLGGFADWYERFPSQPLANRYAAHAHAFGDLATLRRLFRDDVREIHPAHWFNGDQPLDAWRSVSQDRRTPKRKSE